MARRRRYGEVSHDPVKAAATDRRLTIAGRWNAVTRKLNFRAEVTRRGYGKKPYVASVCVVGGEARGRIPAWARTPDVRKGRGRGSTRRCSSQLGKSPTAAIKSAMRSLASKL